MKRGIIRGICAWKVISYFGELWFTFYGNTKFNSGYIGDFYRIATKFAMVMDLANGHLLFGFAELWPTFPGSKSFQLLLHFCWSATRFSSVSGIGR